MQPAKSKARLIWSRPPATHLLESEWSLSRLLKRRKATTSLRYRTASPARLSRGASSWHSAKRCGRRGEA